MTYFYSLLKLNKNSQKLRCDLDEKFLLSKFLRLEKKVKNFYLMKNRVVINNESVSEINENSLFILFIILVISISIFQYFYYRIILNSIRHIQLDKFLVECSFLLLFI